MKISHSPAEDLPCAFGVAQGPAIGGLPRGQRSTGLALHQLVVGVPVPGEASEGAEPR